MHGSESHMKCETCFEQLSLSGLLALTSLASTSQEAATAGRRLQWVFR
jgi:hypothetical protein